MLKYVVRAGYFYTIIFGSFLQILVSQKITLLQARSKSMYIHIHHLIDTYANHEEDENIDNEIDIGNTIQMNEWDLLSKMELDMSENLNVL